MTPSQIRLVRKSFVQIKELSDVVGWAFYQRLFELAPETEGMFKGDMAAQEKKFMSVIEELVDLHLRSLLSLPVTEETDSEAVIPGAQARGERHAEIGVEPRHYGLMRRALLDTLAQTLGDNFTLELSQAWGAAFDVLAGAMRGHATPGAPAERFLAEEIGSDALAQAVDEFDFARDARR